jgi:hypothetical protein
MVVQTIAIIPAILAFLGVLVHNKWLTLLGTIAFLYLLGKTMNLPPYVWIIVIIIMFLWIVNQGKGK